MEISITFVLFFRHIRLGFWRLSASATMHSLRLMRDTEAYKPISLRTFYLDMLMVHLLIASIRKMNSRYNFETIAERITSLYVYSLVCAAAFPGRKLSLVPQADKGWLLWHSIVKAPARTHTYIYTYMLYVCFVFVHAHVRACAESGVQPLLFGESRMWSVNM